MVSLVGGRASGRGCGRRSTTSIRVPMADDVSTMTGASTPASRCARRETLYDARWPPSTPQRPTTGGARSRPPAAAPVRAGPARRRPGSSSTRGLHRGVRVVGVGRDGDGDDGHPHAVADQQHAGGDPPPAHPTGAGAGLAQHDGGRAAGGAPGGDRGGDQRRGDHERGGAGGRRGRRRTRRRWRPCRRSRSIASRARPPNDATTAPSDGGEDGHRPAPRRASAGGPGGGWLRSPGAVPSRCRAAGRSTARVDATEKSTMSEPQPPTTAPMIVRVSRVGVRHRCRGRSRRAWRRTRSARCPAGPTGTSPRTRSRGCRSDAQGQPGHDATPASSSRCASWPATASAVGCVHPAGDPAVDEEHHPVGVRRRHRVVGDHHDGLAELVDAARAAARAPRGAVRESRAPVGSSARTTAGAVDQRPGDRDPLLLAAGELGRQVAGAVAEPDPGRAGRGRGTGPTPAVRRAGAGGATFWAAVR